MSFERQLKCLKKREGCIDVSQYTLPITKYSFEGDTHPTRALLP